MVSSCTIVCVIEILVIRIKSCLILIPNERVQKTCLVRALGVNVDVTALVIEHLVDSSFQIFKQVKFSAYASIIPGKSRVNY